MDAVFSPIVAVAASGYPNLPQADYSSRAVQVTLRAYSFLHPPYEFLGFYIIMLDLHTLFQDALLRLASVDSIELCSEAKVEQCRATRDLRACGREVNYTLNSCGHASLCLECCERVTVCPLCRVPMNTEGNMVTLRVYNECVEAGLIANSGNSISFKTDAKKEVIEDVQRLYSLFDVALENNLVSMICHYVTDVCMDESAVSSNPVIAFLLDEVVVKDWCKRTFRIILESLKKNYTLDADSMRSKIDILLKFFAHLSALSNVLEVLQSSFESSISAKLQDLQLLHESVLKTKEHMEVMIWLLRHNFLENVKSSHSSLASWRNTFCGRKAASVKRSWPDTLQQSSSNSRPGSLFIEDALIYIEQDGSELYDGEYDLSCLAFDREMLLKARKEELYSCYPFENLRAAVDILFLLGTSDDVLAKQAILVYYIFDRYWRSSDDQWRNILEEFTNSIGFTRHSFLESLVFYLLDDQSEESIKKACEILPEISRPTTHPKIAQVLLERDLPEVALMVLRWSGRDTSNALSLQEAITSVRVRVECGLLIESFMHQRTLCSKLKEPRTTPVEPADPTRNWELWVESLVSEICYLCIKNRVVDRLIELPWNSDEEKHVHKCLFDVAVNDPSDVSGSLLVVYYLQRYRYEDAYRVDLKLQSLEQEMISKTVLPEEVVLKMKLSSRHRTELVSQAVGLLPRVQQQAIKSGKGGSDFEADAVSTNTSVPAPAPVPVSAPSLLLEPRIADASKFTERNADSMGFGVSSLQERLKADTRNVARQGTPVPSSGNGFRSTLTRRVSAEPDSDPIRVRESDVSKQHLNGKLRGGDPVGLGDNFRWRLDEASDDDDGNAMDVSIGRNSFSNRGKRRSRFLTRIS